MKKITFLILLFFSTFHLMQAQNVSLYSFVESTEIYTPVVGSDSNATGDDGFDNNIPLGFTFKFGSVDYTTFSISTNGWIRLGNAIGGGSFVNEISNTAVQRPLIAAFWDDNNRGTGAIKYAITGNAPNRMLEVGWDGINIGNNGGTSPNFKASFKMRLYETSNQIDFIYGPEMNPITTISASIGLNDMNSFLSITPGTSTTASSTVANNAVSSTINLLGKKYIFSPPAPCSGIPDPGNTIANAASVCPGRNVFLSLENPVLESGITYQWQSSSNGIDYSDISDAHSPSLNTIQNEASFYRCKVSCGSNSAFSTPVEIGINNFNACFCTPVYTVGMTLGDLISNISITGTTLSNETGIAAVNPYYTYYTGLPNYTATLYSGTDYNLNITTGSYDNQNIAVWIDFNDNGIFDISERVGYTVSSIGGSSTGTLQISIPCDALTGLHRMRVRDVYNIDAQAITPCGTNTYGETEDYDITINESENCLMPIALNAQNITYNSAELSWSLRCSLTNSWDVNVALQGSGIPVGEPTHPNVVSNMSVSELMPLTAYEFYVRSNCGTNGVSDWAGPFVFTTMPPPTTNDECASAIVLTPGANFEQFAVVASNVNASRSPGLPNPTCGVAGFGGDVWFSIVVPADGNVTIELRPTTGSAISDTVLEAYYGSCQRMASLGCDDESGIGSFSMLSLSGLAAGTTIFARVWEYSNDTFGTFQISAWNTTLEAASFSKDQLQWYPNPVKDFLNLADDQKITNIEVYNLLGQQILTKEIQSDKAKIDLSDLSDGSYIVKVYSGNKSKSIKIFKQ